MANRIIPETLFHYTNSIGARGILQSGSIRATNIEYLNDRTEFKHGVEIACRIADERAKTRDGREQEFYVVVASTTRNTAHHFDHIFVASFSELEDSLEMWRGYGDHKGRLAIGLITGYLSSTILRVNDFCPMSMRKK